MNKIEFFVPGLPATAGSKSPFINKKTGRIMLAPANKRQKPWMDSVRACALEVYRDDPLICPIILKITFKLPRPSNHYRTGKFAGHLKDSAPDYHTKKPDLTKMTRAVEDALTKIIWRDDSQVFKHKTKKIYSERIGAEISIFYELT